jgi:hypothetical protein
MESPTAAALTGGSCSDIGGQGVDQSKIYDERFSSSTRSAGCASSSYQTTEAENTGQDLSRYILDFLLDFCGSILLLELLIGYRSFLGSKAMVLELLVHG